MATGTEKTRASARVFVSTSFRARLAPFFSAILGLPDNIAKSLSF
jgi:hypothetical protein